MKDRLGDHGCQRKERKVARRSTLKHALTRINNLIFNMVVVGQPSHLQFTNYKLQITNAKLFIVEIQ